jgi:hypothetical protein
MIIKIDRERDHPGDYEEQQSHTVQDCDEGINLARSLAVSLRIHDRSAGDEIAKQRDGKYRQYKRASGVFGNFHDDFPLWPFNLRYLGR